MFDKRAVCSAESISRVQPNLERSAAVDLHDARFHKERGDEVRGHRLVAAEQVLVQRAGFARAEHAANADATAATQEASDTLDAVPWETHGVAASAKQQHYTTAVHRADDEWSAEGDRTQRGAGRKAGTNGTLNRSGLSHDAVSSTMRLYDVTSIRQANPIEEVVARAGVELQPNGHRLVGSCPFHRDVRPSLVVYPRNESYFCFGCGAGGDVIDFVGRLHGVGFKEAAAMLAGESQHRASPRRAKIIRITSRQGTEPLTGAEADVIDAAASFYHEALWHSEHALAYMVDRGIAHNTARRCWLGFACGGLADHLSRCGLSLAAARRAGLLVGDRDTMLGRIIVPDLKDGRATWLTGRALGPDGLRYLNLRLPTPLLGLGLVRGDEVVVTEGPFDWLTAVRWGLPAVALLGTRVSRATIQGLGRFRRLYLALDRDEAGRRATEQLIAALGSRAMPVELPSGVHDLNDLGRTPAGREAFQRCLEIALKRKETRWQTFDAAVRRQAA